MNKQTRRLHGQYLVYDDIKKKGRINIIPVFYLKVAINSSGKISSVRDKNTGI